MRIRQTQIAQGGSAVGSLMERVIDIPDGEALPPDSVQVDSKTETYPWNTIARAEDAAESAGEVK